MSTHARNNLKMINASHRETHFVRSLVLGASLWYYGCTSHKGDME